MKENLLVAEIDAILPQTQCRRCGFPGCRPYAAAIAEGRAEINQCPPGGEKGVRKLAELLGVSPMPLNAAHGISKPEEVALINEQLCIGCTLCIQACPVDAIIGAAKQMHTVIAAECTGCELCVAPCPVDCIRMVQANLQLPAMGDKFPGVLNTDLTCEREKAAADRARSRYQFRLERLEREKQECQERLAQKAEVTASGNGSSAAANLKKATVQAALERARATHAQASKKNNDAEPLAGISFPNS